MMARALMTKRSRTVGLVGGEMTDPFFPAVAEAVEHRAWESGRTIFASHRNDPKRQAEMLESLWSYAVDGVVFPAPGSIKQRERAEACASSSSTTSFAHPTSHV